MSFKFDRNCSLCDEVMGSMHRHYFGDSMITICEECKWPFLECLDKLRTDFIVKLFKKIEREFAVKKRDYDE